MEPFPMATESNLLPGPAVAVLAGFLLLAIVVMILSSRQSSARKAGLEQFAASHGWQFSGGFDDKLQEVLGEIDPQEEWRVDNVITVEGPPEATYLFTFMASSRNRRSKATYGFGCLGDRTHRR
jgi:hypothetical protein